ncbi:hypothetical protein E4U55_000761 [Claviceps digitariae]|nr:hypothetical protein E4U55_000761 [Claviceps digitariae]
MTVHHPPSHEELKKMDIAKEYYNSITSVSGLQGPADGNVKRMLAADMWKTCFAKDAMSPAAGLRYRQMVLDKGGSVDEAKMVAAFLRREPNSDAYLEDVLFPHDA